MRHLRQSTIKALFFIFLFLQVIPLLNRENMQAIIILDYSIVLSLLFFVSAKLKNWDNSFKYFSLLGLVILSLIPYVLGGSGSIAGYVMCASLPYFLFHHINSSEQILDVLYTPIKWTSVILVIFGAILFYDIKDQILNMQLMVKYFIKASINYVSLLFYGFSLMFFVLYEIKKKVSPSTLTSADFIVGILLLGSSILYSTAYWTRSTFIVSVLLFVLFLRHYKIFIFIFFISFITTLILFRNIISNQITAFFGVGDFKKLAIQDVRMESVSNLIDNATSFNYDFSNTMSDSSLFNLLFCLFPFTLLFLFDILSSYINILMFRNLNTLLFYALLFSMATFICLYQMDFLSVFAMFLLGQIIIFEKRTEQNKR